MANSGEGVHRGKSTQSCGFLPAARGLLSALHALDAARAERDGLAYGP